MSSTGEGSVPLIDTPSADELFELLNQTSDDEETGSLGLFLNLHSNTSSVICQGLETTISIAGSLIVRLLISDFNLSIFIILFMLACISFTVIDYPNALLFEGKYFNFIRYVIFSNISEDYCNSY